MAKSKDDIQAEKAQKQAEKQKRAFDSIINERRYQDQLPENRMANNEDGHTVGDYVAMVAHYTKEALEAYAKRPGDEPAKHELRKIAALCVRCFEEHGTADRQW